MNEVVVVPFSAIGTKTKNFILKRAKNRAGYLFTMQSQYMASEWGMTVGEWLDILYCLQGTEAYKELHRAIYPGSSYVTGS